MAAFPVRFQSVVFREIKKEDFEKGYSELLSQLTVCGISHMDFLSVFDQMVRIR